MVCVPCIVIPVLLWIFHKFIQPFLLKFWNKTVEDGKAHFTVSLDKLPECGEHIPHLNCRSRSRDRHFFSGGRTQV